MNITKIMEKNLNTVSQIQDSFTKMQSNVDLLNLLNLVKPMVYGDKVQPFDIQQLFKFANPSFNKESYSPFQIKKKSGSMRLIHAPNEELKAIQKCLSFILQCVFEPHEAATGFVKEKSIVDNAKKHVVNRYVYNLDLKDFFPSIDQARIWKCLQLIPFNLNLATSVQPKFVKWADFKKEYLSEDSNVTVTKNKEGRLFVNTPIGLLYTAKNLDKTKEKFVVFGRDGMNTKSGQSLAKTLCLVNKVPNGNRLEIAKLIANLCCTEMEVERKDENHNWVTLRKNVLPQGAPTSPVLTNVICKRLDILLTGVAKRFGLKYSRYADDITFSSMHNVYQPESDFLKELHRIIADQSFHIKESKTRLQKDGYRKEVTGLLVNEKVNVQQRYIKQLRMWLYYWERYGYERAASFFKAQYLADKGHVKNGEPFMTNVIDGKLHYLKMVKGADNELYLKLRERFDKLNNELATLKASKYISVEEFFKLEDKEESFKKERENKLVKRQIAIVLDIWETKGIEDAMNFYYQQN